jgi:ketosteroid isomerase-like protein
VPSSSSAAEAAVRVARAEWNAAIAARDTITLARLAADSIVQTSPYFVATGRAQYLRSLGALMTERAAFSLVFTPTQIEVSHLPGSVGFASEYGTWRETWLEGDRGAASGAPAPSELTELRGTYYVIWRLAADSAGSGAGDSRRARRWTMVHEVFTIQSCAGQRYCQP